MTQQVTPREFIMNILNGLAIGTVIVLIPSALLSELCKALLPTFPVFDQRLKCSKSF